MWPGFDRDAWAGILGIFSKCELGGDGKMSPVLRFALASSLGYLLLWHRHRGHVPSTERSLHLRAVLIMSLAGAQPVKPSETRCSALFVGRRGTGYRRAWLRLALFLLPIFVLVVPPVYYVDPFGLFARPSVIPESTRSKYAQQVNQVLWKLPAYGRDPAPNILLGDSQMARLSEQAIMAITGEKYSNLAYGGGTLRESISTFWFASQKVSLRKVFFGSKFSGVTTPTPRDRVTQTEEMVRNPALYFLNSDVLETTEYDIADAAFHHHTHLLPQESKDAFWSSQLQYLPHDIRGTFFRAHLKG